jgi:hypothetical protein
MIIVESGFPVRLDLYFSNLASVHDQVRTKSHTHTVYGRTYGTLPATFSLHAYYECVLVYSSVL